jgi:hypothetical protein
MRWAKGAVCDVVCHIHRPEKSAICCNIYKDRKVVDLDEV